MRRIASSISLLVLLLAVACGGGEVEDPAGDAGGAADDIATEAAGTGGETEGAMDEATDAATGAAAEGDCTSLEGETISFVVPYDAGGGYDQYARMLQPALEEEIGATVVVENQPGAGGLLAINNLLTQEADGTTVAIMNGVGAGGAVIADAEGVQFELDQLSYIGRITSDIPVMVVAADSDYQTFDDLRAAEGVRLGSNGPGAQDFITATVTNAAFEDFDAEIITGFGGSEEIALTLQQGELDTMPGSLASRLSSIDAGDQRAVLVYAREPVEELPDAPLVTDLELDERQQGLVESFLSLADLGRLMVGPPDMAEEPLQCLRTALDNAMMNEEFVATAEQAERPLSHLSGEEVDELIADLTNAPEEFQQVIIEAH